MNRPLTPQPLLHRLRRARAVLRMAAAMLMLMLVLGAAAAPALAAAPAPAAAQPIRVPDTIAQRVAACIACHGRESSSSDATFYPRLSGKPAGYLYNQLRSFRDGRRFNSDMTHLVQYMSDDYLHEIAAYFAGLDLPYLPVPTTTDASAEVLAAGRKLVFQGDAVRGIPACAQCHGLALTGVEPGIPGLLGLPRLYLASQLGAWLTDDRHALAPDCMAQVGRKLTTADVNAVAGWLALQPMPANTHAAASLPGPLPMPCSAMPP